MEDGTVMRVVPGIQWKQMLSDIRTAPKALGGLSLVMAAHATTGCVDCDNLRSYMLWHREEKSWHCVGVSSLRCEAAVQEETIEFDFRQIMGPFCYN